MKFIFLIFICTVSALNLISCSTVISQVQKHNKVPVDHYPPAFALDQAIAEKPPTIDLSKYKSVHLRLKKKNDIAIALAASSGGR